MVNLDKKLAFTIAEALISMLILSIFIALSMKIFTKKHTKPVYNATHGYVMCYRDIATGKVYRKHEAAAPVKQDNDYCEFKPASVANYFVLYAVGGGGGGAAASIDGKNYGGAPGEFITIFVTNIADNIKMYPGKGGEIGKPGEPTYIRNNEEDVSDEERTLLTARGGLAGVVTHLEQEYIRSCKVVPLAKMLKTTEGKQYLDNNQTDAAGCDVNNKRLTASLCPHSLDDIKQKDEIIKFFGEYAKDSYYATYSSYSYWKGNSADYISNVKYDDNCIIIKSLKQKYCINKEKGDKLYACSTSLGTSGGCANWYLVNANTNNSPKCKTDVFEYKDITIDSTTDSTSMAKSHGDFKYLLDLHYDLSTRNSTKYISPSGFGEYLESSALKDDTTAVLYKKDWKNKTSNVASERFEPSQGDGGYYKEKGLPGAVFIAW